LPCGQKVPFISKYYRFITSLLWKYSCGDKNYTQMNLVSALEGKYLKWFAIWGVWTLFGLFFASQVALQSQLSENPTPFLAGLVLAAFFRVCLVRYQPDNPFARSNFCF
jgi:hypothetical protein